MARTNIYTFKFQTIYNAYVNKAERKGRTELEVRQIICWLTGDTAAQLEAKIASDLTMAAFFASAPQINSNASLIKGVVCGVRVETITEPTMQKIRWLDKLIDELAKGKSLNKILPV